MSGSWADAEAVIEREQIAEEEALLRRLDSVKHYGKSCIGVAVEARREAALRLQRKGLVRTWPGSGVDEGLLMVAEPLARAGGPFGGSAA